MCFISIMHPHYMRFISILYAYYMHYVPDLNSFYLNHILSECILHAFYMHFAFIYILFVLKRMCFTCRLDILGLQPLLIKKLSILLFLFPSLPTSFLFVFSIIFLYIKEETHSFSKKFKKSMKL